ncbi:hypothetical protein GSI_04655 [Ganoderma sinense ZZ0214-1]|uniref:Uncharacterized protein n=1 Tax=Ganoderma sinense ZZ0214-1 TaxID=1077348 RepID=A0A2G8SHF1_9APHY|nr:hypothetical protein GSI_04655 [Ganoderma sinense ZZ0214-1]
MLERSLPQVLAPSFQHFSERVSPYLALHAHRIASLTVSLSSHTELIDLWSCLNAGMRSLETLSISIIDGRSWALVPQNQDEDLHLSPTSLPRLARVSAPGSFLHRFVVPSLRHIDLKLAEPQHLDSPHPLESDEHLRNALAICAPNLESLALRNVSPPGGYDSTTPLSLPALRKLLIHDYPHQCAPMLSRLTLPDTAHIHVFIDSGASLCAAVPPSAPPIHAALAATDSVGILRVANTTTVHCSAGETQLLTISLTEPRAGGQGGGGGGVPPDDLLRFFGGAGKPGAPVGVIAIGDLDGRDVRAVDLRAFPSLLGIITGESMGHHILKELARTDGPDNDDDEGMRTAICPELDMLSLEFKFDFVRLLQEPGDSGEGADSLPAPAPAHGAADDDDVEERRRSLCAELERVLSQRAKMGTRLSRLALGGSQEQELRTMVQVT